jgi:iron(III) transport system ATP-binding protein
MSPAVSAESLWQLSGVRFFGPPTLWPREPLDLAIPPACTALLGPSGAGKTSLIEVLVGLNKPHGGTVRGPSRLAWVPQDHGLWHAHTVGEHLTLVGASTVECDALLATFDLAGVSDARADSLSLGEAARLSVARALAQKAPVLVMDEPLAHVDTARAGKYWRAIREHVARTEASLLLATHSAEIALAEAEQAICLRNGGIIFNGKIAALYDQPASEDLANFLGPANWLTPADTSVWLGATWPDARCVRPERLMISPTDAGRFTVTSSRFLGTSAETELRTSDGSVRMFIHRPTGTLPQGARAHIHIADQNP